MAALNYAQQYQQALQQAFKVDLRFVALYGTSNNNVIKWVNANTIQIPKITTGGFVDVNRDAVGSFTRNVDNSWTPLTVAHDREFRTLVDPVDIDETNMAVTISNITQVFNTEHKIPEMDKYLASKIATDYEDAGGVPNQTVLTTENVLTIYDTMMEEMDDAEVPTEGRILYVTPAVNTLIKQADDINRTIQVRDAGNAINRNVRSLDDVKIVIVPSSRMMTVYDFTSGAVVDETALQINMLLIHPRTVYTPQKYQFVSLDEPNAATGGKWLYYERKYWDVFLEVSKIAGIKINREPDPA